MFCLLLFVLTSCLAVVVRDCSIITSPIGGGWVSAFFVMLRDGKQGGEWYFMKEYNVTVKKKIIKYCFCTIVKRSGLH